MARSGWWRLVPALVLVLVLVAPSATRAADVTGVTLHLPGIGGMTVSGTVHDSHGAPVAGASVGLCEQPDSCFDVSAQSGADGSFTVHGARAGAWYLVAMPPEGANLVAAYGAAGGTSTHDSSAAVAMEISADVSGLAPVLDDGLRITGRVLDPLGDPVAGVTVGANGAKAGSGDVTGADGTYAAVGLSAGVGYQLQVWGPDGSPFLSGWVQDGTVQADANAGTLFTPGPGDVTDADITMVRGRSISGQLTGMGSAALEVVAFGGTGSPNVPVDADGTFSVFPMWPGSYWLLFSVRETVEDLDSQFPYGIYNGDGQVLASQYDPGVQVDVAAGDVGGLSAVLPVLPSISGTITDASGPLAGARVGFCEPDLGCGSTVVDGAGHYTFVNVPNGEYTIRAVALDHVIVWRGAAGPVTDATHASPVMVAGSSVAGVNLALPTGSSISGTILDGSGVPVEGANVIAVEPGRGINEFGPGYAFTDAAGHFTLRGLKDGDYYLSAGGPEGAGLGRAYWSLPGSAAAIEDAVMLHVGAADTSPRVTFKTGRQVSSTRVPVLVTWPSAGTNVKAYGLHSQVNGGTWTTAGSFPAASSERTFAPSSSTTHRFRILAGYKDLTSTLWGVGPTFRLLLTQQTSSAITWRGTWKTVRATSASGGSYRVASGRGAAATFTFTGRAMAWVAMRGTGFGKATVSVDGGKPVVVDLRAGSTMTRRIVFAKSWTTSAKHTVKIVSLGTAGHPRVDVDAFTVIR